MVKQFKTGFMINPSRLNDFRDFVEEKCGIFFQDQQLNVLEGHIMSRMAVHGIEDAEEYFNKYSSKMIDSTEFKHLLVQISNNETSFFRNVPQFKALSDIIFPAIRKQKELDGNMEINVWCAGCSTGDEPFSVAISLLEAIPSIYLWTINVLATDIDVVALSDAKKGEYLKRSLRIMPEAFIKKYFTFRNDLYCVNPLVTDFVNFQEFNLAMPQYPRPQSGHWDVILFRNVMIYFRDDFVHNVIKKMSSVISENGYLLLGHSETLQNKSDDFELMSFDNAFIYRKFKGKEKKPDVNKEKKSVDGTSFRMVKTLKDIESKKTIDSKSDKVKETVDEKDISKATLNKVKELIKANDYQDVIKILKDEVIQHPLDEEGHYFLGLSYFTENELVKAEKELKTTVYINSDHFMARFFLGKTYQHIENLDRAIIEFKNALKLLDSSNQNKVEEIEGFSKEALKKMCVSFINRLTMQIL